MQISHIKYDCYIIIVYKHIFINVFFYLLVLVSEGYKAPYIGFIKSGECHVLRQVEVMKTKHGQKVRIS